MAALQGTEYSSQWGGKAGVFEASDGNMYAIAEASASPSGHLKDSTGKEYTVQSGYIGLFPCDMCGSYGPCSYLFTPGPIIFSARNGVVRLVMEAKTIVIDARSREEQMQAALVTMQDSSSDEGVYD